MQLTAEAQIGYPRFFNLGGYWINSYKFFLIIGIYVGSLVSAALAESAGRRPLAAGLAAMTSALFGLVGARVYYLLVHAKDFLHPESRQRIWDTRGGGWGVFGALITFVPASYVAAWFVGESAATLWDFMSGGVLAGGFWIRLGCVFNGCCVGRPSDGWLRVRLHDTEGRYKSRIPVQFLEMLWWLLGGALFLTVWPTPLRPGDYALGVLTWYGVGRFVLEPLREQVDVVFGRIPINQLIAASLAIASSVVLLLR
jgi:prolipoprotein diacylglyceryltransferase